MNKRALFALPLLLFVAGAQAEDEGAEMSNQELARIQNVCDAYISNAGLIGDAAEQMRWICVGNLRDYDASGE